MTHNLTFSLYTQLEDPVAGMRGNCLGSNIPTGVLLGGGLVIHLMIFHLKQQVTINDQQWPLSNLPKDTKFLQTKS